MLPYALLGVHPKWFCYIFGESACQVPFPYGASLLCSNRPSPFLCWFEALHKSSSLVPGAFAWISTWIQTVNIRNITQETSHQILNQSFQGRKNSINLNFLVRISRGHSWPLRPDDPGSKSFSPSPGPQKNALFGADVHDFWRGRPWPEGFLKNFVQKKVCVYFFGPYLWMLLSRDFLEQGPRHQKSFRNPCP